MALLQLSIRKIHSKEICLSKTNTLGWLSVIGFVAGVYLLSGQTQAQNIQVLGTPPDPFQPVTEILAELRENGEFMSLEMVTLGQGQCEGLASNVTATGAKLDVREFVKECDGVAVSLLQQAEMPELPRSADIAVVTYINYGNIPFAKKRPDLFFGNGQFYFPGIVATAKKKACENLELLRDQKAEIASRYMVDELFAYDVRVTYKAMGIVSIRYFLDKTSESYYPTRHDFNFTCDD